MATAQPISEALIYKLPINGMRNGESVVVGYAQVLNDLFCVTRLLPYSWSLSSNGYVRRGYKISGTTFHEYLHEAVFFYYHGERPPGLEIDHKDRDKRNNLPTNLRAVTSRVNNTNRATRNPSGFRGVTRPTGCKRWQARVKVDGRSLYLGFFDRPEDAARAVNEAYKKYFPECQVPNPLS